MTQYTAQLPKRQPFEDFAVLLQVHLNDSHQRDETHLSFQIELPMLEARSFHLSKEVLRKEMWSR